MNLIDKLFKNRGIKDVSELKPEEKTTYDQLVKDLKNRTKPITFEDWIKFLEEQSEKIIESYNPDQSEKKKDFLWTQIFLIEKLLVFLKGPTREEEKIKKEYNVEE